MGWADDLSNSMGMNVTPVYGQQASTAQDPALRDNLVRLAQQGFEEEVRRADRDYDLNKKKAKRDYETALMNAKTSRDVMKANRDYQEAQAQNARERLAFDRESTAARLQFDKETQAQNFGLAQAKLGYDVLNMSSQLRGPENYFQSANFSRGAANNPGTSTFLSALKNNVTMPDFGAQYGVPDPETLSTLSSKLGTQLGSGAGTSTTAGGNDAYLNNIRGLYAAGAHRLGAGALENLTGTERKLLTSGIDAIGGDSSTFMDQYRRSRVGQGVGAGSMAA